VAQGVGPEFKPNHCKKTKQKTHEPVKKKIIKLDFIKIKTCS
jgi:hypothetical protein